MSAAEGNSVSLTAFAAQRRRMALPEKLCFLVDTHPEMGTTWESDETRVEAAKAAIRLIVRRKVNLSAAHQYAVCSYDQKGRIQRGCEFTNKISEIDAALHALQLSSPIDKADIGPMDMSTLLDQLQIVLFDDGSTAASLDNKYVNRCVLIYGRSFEIPQYCRGPQLLQNRLFYLDVLYMHHRGNIPGAQCQEIFDVLCEIQDEASDGSDSLGKISYILESHPSPLKFLPTVGALLAHPVQRGDLYADDGLLARMDPSEAALGQLRERLQEAVQRSKRAQANDKKGGQYASTDVSNDGAYYYDCNEDINSAGGKSGKPFSNFKIRNHFSLFGSKKS